LFESVLNVHEFDRLKFDLIGIYQRLIMEHVLLICSRYSIFTRLDSVENLFHSWEYSISSFVWSNFRSILIGSITVLFLSYFFIICSDMFFYLAIWLIFLVKLYSDSVSTIICGPPLFWRQWESSVKSDDENLLFWLQRI
jgi:hypothetical protein